MMCGCGGMCGSGPCPRYPDPDPTRDHVTRSPHLGCADVGGTVSHDEPAAARGGRGMDVEQVIAALSQLPPSTKVLVSGGPVVEVSQATGSDAEVLLSPVRILS